MRTTNRLPSPPSPPLSPRWNGLLAVVVACAFFVSACGFLGIGGDEGPPPNEPEEPEPSDTSATLLSYEGKDLFLNGGNVAWNNFARDVGPNPNHPEMTTFSDIFQQVSDKNGSTLRLWLHTNGAHTPAWDDSAVVGPGENTIDDLRALLDEAQQHDVGIVVCLWSFDMLRRSYGSEVTDRAHALLTERDLTETYLDNALEPMVEALSDHPALLAWEIFNEPEGMTEEFGWDGIRHVPFRDVLRFINLTAGAIHRVDPNALVTSGAWSFSVLTDGTLPGTAEKMPPASSLRASQVRAIQHHLGRNSSEGVTSDAARSFYRAYRKSSHRPRNYYRDDRLVDAGGDERGTLDFYSVHYYEWAGTAQSPFHHDHSTWGLDKPVVVAEFFLGGSHDDGDGNPNSTYGVAWEDLYPTLYDRGYAGALGWQWFDWDRNRDGLTENWPRALDNMQFLYEAHPDAVHLPIDVQS